MNRRQVLIGLLATAPTIGLAGAVTEGCSKHWLDSVSSEDIEAALRRLDADGAIWKRFRNSIGAIRRQSKARKRREQRTDNVVVWRGIVSEPLPDDVMERLRSVRGLRRDVEITSINEACVWQAITIPPASRVLIDHRLIDHSIIDACAEIIDTPHKGRRIHIWPR